MTKMRAAQVRNGKGPFEIVEREIPEPGPGAVRVKVQASGICHSDSLTKEGLWPGIRYPRVPGHEVAGVVDAIGAGVADLKVGARVGLGWHGGHCGYCASGRRGDFVTCQAGQIPGITFDGGHAYYAIAPAVALARIPDGLSPTDAGNWIEPLFGRGSPWSVALATSAITANWDAHIYNRADLLPERASALAAWSRWIENVAAGATTPRQGSRARSGRLRRQRSALSKTSAPHAGPPTVTRSSVDIRTGRRSRSDLH